MQTQCKLYLSNLFNAKNNANCICLLVVMQKQCKLYLSFLFKAKYNANYYIHVYCCLFCIKLFIEILLLLYQSFYKYLSNLIQYKKKLYHKLVNLNPYRFH